MPSRPPPVRARAAGSTAIARMPTLITAMPHQASAERCSPSQATLATATSSGAEPRISG
ncbi:hypothetical protein D9M72_319230 [compost metagenome]